MARKIIITCAITGSIHTPSMSAYLPITPDEIVAQAIAAAEAGASIIHLHARDPKDGRPSADPDLFMQFLPRIKQETGAILNITTGGAGMSLDQRIAAAERAARDVLTQHGLDELRAVPRARRNKDCKYDWEKLFLKSEELVFPQYILQHRNPQNGSARGTACGSSSNATTSATSTTWPT